MQISVSGPQCNCALRAEYCYGLISALNDEPDLEDTRSMFDAITATPSLDCFRLQTGDPPCEEICTHEKSGFGPRLKDLARELMVEGEISFNMVKSFEKPFLE